MRRTAATRNVVQAGSPIRRRFRFLAIEFGLESDDANADPESRNLRPNWNFRICVSYTHTEYDFVHQTLGRARRRGASRCDEALARWRRADEHGDVPQVRRELGAREPVPGAAVRGLRHAVPRERLWRTARNVQVFRPAGRVPEGATRAARLPPPRSRARAGPRAPPPARARRAPEPGIARAPGPVRGGRVSPTRGRNRGQIISRRTRPESGPGFRVGTRGDAERAPTDPNGPSSANTFFHLHLQKKKTPADLDPPVASLPPSATSSAAASAAAPRAMPR